MAFAFDRITRYKFTEQHFAPCKGILNPESNIFLPLESGIQGFGIRNLIPGIRNPTRGIRNPTSSITLESRSGMHCTISSNFKPNHHLLPPLGDPYHRHHHHHHQKVFGSLTRTLNMSTLRLGGISINTWFRI